MAGGPTTSQPLPPAPDDYDRGAVQQILRDIEQRLRILEGPSETGYAVTNLTVSRTFDADTVTLAELADIVGTLIDDEKAKGRLA